MPEKINTKTLDTETLIEVAVALTGGKLMMVKAGDEGWKVFSEKTLEASVVPGYSSLNEALFNFISTK